MEPLSFITDIFNIGIGTITLGAAVSALILLGICIVRCFTELVLCSIRMAVVYKNKKQFKVVDNNKVKEINKLLDDDIKGEF